MLRLDLETKSDARICLAILGIALLFTLPFLGNYEYFKHTEADRTLIGWEMAQSGDYLVPHLLGDHYLTKPPLFYAILGLVFRITAVPYEWAARLPSAIFSALLLLIFYLFQRRAGSSRRESALGTLILGSIWPWFQASVVAEMDMTYTFFSALTLFAAFLSFGERKPLLYTLLCWMLAAVAFLVKGPPVLAFLGFGVVFYAFWELLRNRAYLRFFDTGLRHFAGLLVFIGILWTWAWLLEQRVSAEDLKFHFETEILRRFVADPLARERARGVWYYPLGVFAAFLPWSLSLPGLLWLRLKGVVAGPVAPVLSKSRLDLFALMAVLPALIFFSFASGKSSRYLLPLYPFIALLLQRAVLSLARALKSRQLWLSEEFPTRLLWGFSLVLLLARVPYQSLIADHRNRHFSAPQAAAVLSQAVPEGQRIYILEMFERWIPYYMIRSGREVLRLSPSLARNIQAAGPEERVYLLLSRHTEPERYQEIPGLDPSSRILAEADCGRRRLSLMEMSAQAAARLQLERIFPTEPARYRRAQLP